MLNLVEIDTDFKVNYFNEIYRKIDEKKKLIDFLMNLFSLIMNLHTH